MQKKEGKRKGKKKKGANKEFQKERELSKRKERNYQPKQEHFPELVHVCLQRAHITPQTRKSISPPRHIILKFQKTEAGQKFDPWKIPWTEEPGGLQSMGSQSRT